MRCYSKAQKEVSNLTLRVVHPSLNLLVKQSTLMLVLLAQLLWCHSCLASKRALLIGIDQYQDAQITSLSAADADAERMALALNEVAGFPKENIITLTSKSEGDAKPTRTNIVRALDRLSADVKAGDLIFVLYSGHGIQLGEKSYLVPCDAVIDRSSNLIPETALEATYFTRKLHSLAARGLIVAFDMCRNDPLKEASKSFGPTRGITAKQARDLVKVPVDGATPPANTDTLSVATLFSSQPGERSWERARGLKPEQRRGYFTYFLEQGLRGAAEKQPGDGVRVRDLVDYLQLNVPRAVQNELGQSVSQKPYPVLEGPNAAGLMLVPPRNLDIEILTDPPGAGLSIVGTTQPAQQTPCRLNLTTLNLESSKALRLRVEMPGYAPSERILQMRRDASDPGLWRTYIVDGSNAPQSLALTPGATIRLKPWKLEKLSTKVSLRIKDKPAGARVLVNGVERKETSSGAIEIDLENSDGDDFRIEVQKSGFVPNIQYMSLKPGDKEREFKVILVPEPPARVLEKTVPVPTQAALHIDSEPRGARVFLDGEEQKGKLTPCDFSYELPAGQARKIKVELVKDGFEPRASSVVLPVGQTSLGWELPTLPPIETRAFYRLQTDPPGAEIYLDDQQIVGKQTPCDLETSLSDAATKSVEVRLEREGFEPLVRQITLERGQSRWFEWSLSPILTQARLTVDSTPAGAQVFLNGEAVPNKLTPCQVEVPVDGDTTQEVSIKVVKAGYDVNEKKLQVRRGLTLYYDSALNRRQPARLSLITSPPGAQVFLDDVEQIGGATPWKIEIPLENREPRTVSLRVVKEGYGERTETIVLESGRNTQLNWQLKRQVATADFDWPEKVPRLDTIVSADHTLFAHRDAQKGVTLYNSQGRRLSASSFTGSLTNTVAFAPNQPVLAVGTGNIVANEGPKVWLWNFDTGQETPLKGHDRMVLALAFSRDGRMLATGGSDEDVILWNTVDGGVLGRISVDNPVGGSATSIAFSPDGALLAIGYGDPYLLRPLNTTIRVWDISSPRSPVSRYTLTRHAKSVKTLSFSHDGKLLASGGDALTVVLWNMESGEALRTFNLTDQTMSVQSVAFSPDDTLLACGGGQSISVFQIDSGERLKLLRNQFGVDSVNFAPTGHLSATATNDLASIQPTADVP